LQPLRYGNIFITQFNCYFGIILKILFTAFLFYSPQVIYAQFLGGEADGHASIRLSNATCSTINVSPFLGGQADGHVNGRISNVVCSSTNINPFSGGIADGYANVGIRNIICPVINNNPFSGGGADGHTHLRLSNVVCAVINNNPFLGGEADGYANNGLTNVSKLTCLNILMPIELLNFEAKLNGKVVDLFWSTASEVNNDYFTVERSKNGIVFEKVLEIDGAGNSASTLSYSTIDKNPFTGISYYRLKQTDFNKNFKYSNMVAVKLEEIILK
jgi:hypothetical protein